MPSCWDSPSCWDLPSCWDSHLALFLLPHTLLLDLKATLALRLPRPVGVAPVRLGRLDHLDFFSQACTEGPSHPWQRLSIATSSGLLRPLLRSASDSSGDHLWESSMLDWRAECPHTRTNDAGACFPPPPALHLRSPGRALCTSSKQPGPWSEAAYFRCYWGSSDRSARLASAMLAAHRPRGGECVCRRLHPWATTRRALLCIPGSPSIHAVPHTIWTSGHSSPCRREPATAHAAKHAHQVK